MNKDLRKKIVQMVYNGKDGHIPSAFSIVDILEILYRDYLKFDPKRPYWPERDYFVLSKGHGCLALYVVLAKHGFINERDIGLFCHPEGILGEHPDCTKVPGIEASTGSLGHGLSFAVGIALGLRIRGMKNKIYVLVGDGECHEGTVWEAANVANNLQLGNLCVIVDWNGSAAQLMPRDDLLAKWQAFGWNAMVTDGHSETDLKASLDRVKFQYHGTPNVIIAKTVKGKGIPMMEGHGIWHHRIPNEEEFKMIIEALS
ncbi:MAG: transketolase [Candidatus Omnitrophica bacterium]|nr:transketolase [Candidatus Omnitrophota bacterium]